MEQATETIIPIAAAGTRRLSGDASGVEAAARLIASGETVAFPTETVYGLGADATDPRAVSRIFAAKERPRFNPLIAHVASLEAAEEEGLFDERARDLARRFWPGPLTLVVPRGPGGAVCDLAAAGLATLGLRVPANPLALGVLAAVGRPVAAPSANRSGRISPTRFEHVLADLDGRIAAVLDGGATPVGVESTIVACLPGQPARLLRPGGVPAEAIEAELGAPLARAEQGGETPPAPGMLASHYAPAARLRLRADIVHPGEALLAFGGARPKGTEAARACLDLSPAGDLVEAAANLFAYLRSLDDTGAAAIAVTSVPREGLGEAINDRLERAAAPRS